MNAKARTTFLWLERLMASVPLDDPYVTDAASEIELGLRAGAGGGRRVRLWAGVPGAAPGAQ
jgi:hypothetical protein